MRAEHGASFSIVFAVTSTLLSLVTDLGARLMFRIAFGLIEMTKAAPPMIAAPVIIASASPAAHTAAPMAMPGLGMFASCPCRSRAAEPDPGRDPPGGLRVGAANARRRVDPDGCTGPIGTPPRGRGAGPRQARRLLSLS
ncbi:hypothetical protein [Paracoccus sp. ME4]|uniref:hypothetical protein n=1 Tax=Paracoccus sp. ME4 TaxID=3138066 RepID=UPI00398A8AC0